MKSVIYKEFDEHIKLAETIFSISDDIERAANIIINCLKNGGKILLFGNGGSAADAQHIAAELVGRFKVDRKGLAAIALTTDSSALTSIGNDYSFNMIFLRQVEALAKPDDVIFGISTSGSSENVLNALKFSKDIGCKTIGLSGRGGGEMSNICNVNIVVPNDDTPRIQEMHILIGHTICHLIDESFKD